MGGCAVWGRFQNGADMHQLNNARQQALVGGYAMTPIWTGADGISRQVVVVASAPASVNVVFLPPQDGEPAALAAAPNAAVAAPSQIATVNNGASTPELSASQVDTAGPIPTAAAVGQAGTGAASVRMCRNITTTAIVAGQTDNATELWCRNDQGDYAPATQVASQ
jgi:hypothetical protein